jgi:beta-lactamase regulating signal transducer with metallopeptidase domain
MTAWIISSCALILCVILLRAAAGDNIPPVCAPRCGCWWPCACWCRAWLSAATSAWKTPCRRGLAQTTGYDASSAPETSAAVSAAVQPATSAAAQNTAQGAAAPESRSAAESVDWGTLLPLVWMYGACAAAVWFAGVNLRLYLELKNSRRRLDMDAGGAPVYVTDAVPTPCLFGFVRPGIYLTPRAAEYDRCDCVIAHEAAHLARRDNWRCLLRCACLCAWWWNPLAWWAAALSREDAELACDEKLMKNMDAAERLAYGGALLDMVAVGRPARGLICASTPMTSGKREMKKRLRLIANRPRTRVPAAAVTALLAVLLTGCAFTGAKAPEPRPQQTRAGIRLC